MNPQVTGRIAFSSGTGAEKSAGGYYMNAAQSGEAEGRWFGPGAAALGLVTGQVVERGPYEAVYRQLDPRSGEKLGRARGNYVRYEVHLARLRSAEPHATAERRLELEREAHRLTREPAPYTDVTVSFSNIMRSVGLTGPETSDYEPCWVQGLDARVIAARCVQCSRRLTC